MTAELRLRCDGPTPATPCPGRNTFTGHRPDLDALGLRFAADRYGWTHRPGADRCPTCTRTPAPADDPARCWTCGSPADAHPWRHPFTHGHRARPELRP